MLNLAEVKFREDDREGGTIVEYKVDGRVKAQPVPRMVGGLLEALVSEWKRFDEAFKAFEEWKHERSEHITGRDGGNGASESAGHGAGGRRSRPAGGKEKARAGKA